MKVNALLVLLLSWILFMGAVDIKQRTIAYDEGVHWQYGLRISQLQSDRLFYPQYIDDSKMPVSVINALPCLISHCPARSFGKPESEFFTEVDFNMGRIMTVLFACLLGLFVFHWSRKWYGQEAGYLSLFLYAFCPNILAHSQFISTDIYAAGFTAFAVYCFWRFIDRPGWKNAGLSALCLGLAQLVKYTCLFLYPLFIFIVFVKYLPALLSDIRERRYSGILKAAQTFLKFSLFFVVVNLLIINAGYFFNKTMTPLKKYPLYSQAFLAMQNNPVLSSVPVPLPYPYIQGLDRSMFNERTGSSIGNIYLLGKLQEVRTPEYQGFKGYYFIASLFKVPIPTLIIFFLALLVFLRNFRKSTFWEREIFIAVPVLFFMIQQNYFYRMQIGIRHFLIIFPLVFVFCGSLLGENAFSRRRSFRLALLGLALYLVVSVCSYSPYFLSYFNEFIGDRKLAYKILADSNLDIGCNIRDLKNYHQQNPDAIFEPEQPTAGRIVVGINELVGLFNKNKFRWLRENFEPVDTVAYSYLVYDIRPEDLKKLAQPFHKAPHE